MFKNLIYEKSDSIAVLTINRPEKLNALNNETISEMISFLDQVEKDSDLRALIITGSGEKAFVAGADINELDEREAWHVEAGTRAYVTRADGSLIAFERGTEDPAEVGFHAIGAHTDSPNLRVKPLPDRTTAGVRQLTIEPYGGLLLARVTSPASGRE